MLTVKIVSIPYGKGKGEHISMSSNSDELYQFPMGKVKLFTFRSYWTNLKKYQFPMGKVKGLLCIICEGAFLSVYQFPMGKVKSIVALLKDKYKYQFPMGKVKLRSIRSF